MQNGIAFNKLSGGGLNDKNIIYSFCRFAEQDLYLNLASIVRRFKLEYPPGESMDQIYNTLLFPDRPVRVRFMDRE